MTALPRLAAATVYEASGQRGALPRQIRSLRPGTHLQGEAFTVVCGPRDNLALHHALAQAPKGSVIVCHTGGHYDAGYIGDVMVTAAESRGIAGLVIDGCVRDDAEISSGPVAVFARGLSVRGTTKDPRLTMSLGARLRIGDVDVDPGDLIVADDDGVVIVSSSDVSEHVSAALGRETSEASIRAQLREGRTTLEIYQLPDLADPGAAPAAR